MFARGMSFGRFGRRFCYQFRDVSMYGKYEILYLCGRMKFMVKSDTRDG